MTNEEKAREISDKLVDDVKDGLCDGIIRGSALYGALKMAKWKDKEFDKILLEIAIQQATNASEIKPILNKLKDIKP